MPIIQISTLVTEVENKFSTCSIKENAKHNRASISKMDESRRQFDHTSGEGSILREVDFMIASLYSSGCVSQM